MLGELGNPSQWTLSHLLHCCIKKGEFQVSSTGVFFRYNIVLRSGNSGIFLHKKKFKVIQII